MRLDHLLSRERREAEKATRIPGRTRGRRETEESAEEAGETGKTAGESHKTDIIAKAERKRGGSVLTELSLYRFEGSQETSTRASQKAPELTSATPTGGRSMADPAGKSARQQMEAETVRRTLKTAQGERNETSAKVTSQ